MLDMLLLLLLPFSSLAYDADPDLVGDIFGTQQVEQSVGEQRSIEQETRCDELRPCVECSVFRQYWKHFGSAYECHKSCSQYNFVYQPGRVTKSWYTITISSLAADTVCTQDYSPVCGIDGHQYSNTCSAQNINGIGVSCTGDCPCPSTGIPLHTWYLAF